MPAFASGCTSSSRIWNSQPIAEPSPLLSSVSTKYLTPLLAPFEMLNSTISSKLAYWLALTMSPPAADSRPSPSSTVRRPSRISHPLAGNRSSFAPLQPAVVFPSPVSYTHLRAHETRHDLVCRLLLEKKKKK